MVHVHLAVLYDKIKMRDKAKFEWKRAQSLASADERKKLRQEWDLVAGR